MIRKVTVLLVVMMVWLWLPDVVRADEPVHTITVTTNISTTLGCARYYSSTWNTVQAEPGYQAICTSTVAHEYVGVFVSVNPTQLDTWNYTTAPISKTNTVTDVWADWDLAVYWDGTAYTGTNWVTYTITLLEPTPTPTAEPSPTPTYDPTIYSREYRLLDLPYKMYLPYVARNGNNNGDMPGEIGSDTTWWEWAQAIEAFFAPIFERITDVRFDIYELNDAACGNPWTVFVPPIDPTSIGPELSMGDDASAQQVAFAMGWSMGRPMAWLRSINDSNNVFGLNFFVMLVYFLAGGITWIVFVTVITYSVRFIRMAVDFVIRIYELIPFKAT
jgi:hypothetical protein